MRVREVATGLWWWTALHPAWTPADGGPDGWEQEVGCVYYEAPGAVVLIDPLVPMEDRDRFFRALDRDVERAGLPVRVLVTVEAHRRSSAELAERYGGTVGELPEGVEVAVAPFDEHVFWIPEHGRSSSATSSSDATAACWLPRTWIGRSTTPRWSRACARCSTCRSSACSSATASRCSRARARRWRQLVSL